MRLFRITRAHLAHTALNGDGAARFGGRWNSPGTPMVYTATSLALAALEVLVHLDMDAAGLDYVFIEIEVAKSRIHRPGAFPAGWDSLPESRPARTFGDAWAKGGSSLGLAVPSLIIPQETNVLLNPAHEDFGTIRSKGPQAFVFDPRLRV